MAKISSNILQNEDILNHMKEIQNLMKEIQNLEEGAIYTPFSLNHNDPSNRLWVILVSSFLQKPLY